MHRGSRGPCCSWLTHVLHPSPRRALTARARAGTLRPFGLEGWRFAFVILGVISGCIGVVNFFFSADPRCARGGARPDVELHKEEVSLGAAVQGMRSVLCVPTFLIVVFQARPLPCVGGCCLALLLTPTFLGGVV